MSKFTRGIALFLCLVMLLGLIPTAALAAEEGDVPAAVDMSDIDFTKAEAAKRFTVVNQESTQIQEGEGLYLVSTMNAMEPSGDQLSSEEQLTPKDLVEIPVEGDWTATMQFLFDQGSSRGWYEFFGFYAKAGDDYNNLVGIRGADGDIQDFLRKEGAIDAGGQGVKDPISGESGLKASDVHWFRMAKEGTTYTCTWSLDGEEFVDLFAFENTGIEAEALVIDAYGGMQVGYNYKIQNIDFEVAGPPDIDFTDPASADRFTVVNQASTEIKAGEGLYMVTTKDAFEPCNGQVSTFEPKDVVEIPMEGDWTATLRFVFDPSGSANGYYQFFGFYAKAGDDYNNLVGIRGGDGALQDFIRKDGEVTAEGSTSAPGLVDPTTYWYRIKKAGTTYTCFRSEDGENFDEMFSFKDTGIEANALVIDAYTGMTEVYAFYVENLSFKEKAPKPEGPVDTRVPIYEDASGTYSFAERAADLVARMNVSQKGSQLISSPAPAISARALGGGALNTKATKNLPQYYWWNEGLHGYNRIDNGAGVRGGGAGPANSVSYPQSLTVGSTWNPELYYTEALQVSDEIRERTSRNTQTGNAIDLNFYSPTVNLQRDPRWGRNEESYSEDPYLTVKMGSQYVLGLEGKNQDGSMIDPDGYYKVHSTIKHYVANNSENNRLNGGAVTDLYTLRNYFVAPYRDIIKATDVTSVMTAYSDLNGEPCSFSSYLMDTLLRQTFGLSGHITSDCDSVGTMNRHNYVNPHTGRVLTDVERLAGALAHGEDLECNGGYRGTGSYSAYANQMVNGNVQTDAGLFTENTFDIALHRLMTARISTGEFDEGLALTEAAMARIDAQKAAKPNSGVPNQTDERLAIVDAVNNEGVVMLKNEDSFLPLDIPAEGEYKVVIAGAWQTNMYFGLYSANSSNSENHINIQKGITDAIKSINPNATFTYITSDSVSASNQAAIEAADVCVVVGGANNSYSAEDRDRNTIALPNNQADMFAQVGKWNPNTIAVMETCGPMETSVFSDHVKAILWSSYGGHHKGVGFGNIITGKVNPSGKVTATWYHSTSEIPGINDYNMYATNGSKGRTYMYYTGEADFPFGYGLSFTTFEYSNLKIDKTAYDANDTVKVSFDVKNTGDVAGKEVTQLYIAQPDAPAELRRPIRQLKGFDKIELQPGETKSVSMEVAIPDLAFYSEEADCFQVDTGKYQVQVGTNSAEANLTADFTVSGKMDVYPEVLTVKANAVGDTENGISQRLIYAKGDTINPQLTVAMNDESLYGYIMENQMSPIKSYESCPLPEGMTFTYESNRPEVVAVENGEIKAVGAGVATITITGKLGDTVVTADFVAYVEAAAAVGSITVDGEALEGFDTNKYAYEILVEGNDIPEVAATADGGLQVTVTQAAAIPGVATVVCTDPASGMSETYRIGFGTAPVSTDFAAGWEAAQAKGWAVEGANDNAAFGENGLTITGEAGLANNFYYEPAFGTWAAQTNMSVELSGNGQQAGLLVKDNADNYVKLAYGRSSNANAVTATAVINGTETQVASAALTGNAVSLRIVKEAGEYTFAYSADGSTWTKLSGSAKVSMAEPKLGVFCGGSAGATATFDGISIVDTTDITPTLAALTVDGKTITGFDAKTFVYNVEVAQDASKAPVIAATATNPNHKLEITQISAATGTAKVVVSSDAAASTYTVSFNYGPVDDYFADGSIGELWTIEKELKDEYQLVKGEGLKLYTQAVDYYQDGDEWHNAFTMPAQGNWRVVAKAHYPTSDLETYQQLTMSVWEDEDNYVRICCQEDRLYIEPGQEINGEMHLEAFETANAVANADGTVTIYFCINKNDTEYTVSYSQNGIDFKTLGTVVANYADPKIVLTGGQNTDNTPTWLNFEYLAVVSKDGVDANTGYLEWACQNVADYVAADLPAQTKEDLSFSKLPHGYTLKVESSDAAIAADGSVTPAASDKEVQLTLTVSDGQASASATKTVKVPGTGSTVCEHDYKAVVTAPTCTEAGYTTYTCSKCEDSYKDDEVAALGHDYGEWKLTTAATCTEKGVETRECARCDAKENRDVAALGHDYGEWTVTTAATCTEKGVETRECSRCDESETRDIDALGHKFEDGVCTVCGEKDPAVHDCPSKDFIDVPAVDDWAHAGIDYCVEEGLMNGTSATLFSPANSLTRAQIATILYRIAGEPEVEYKAVFSDVADGVWYTKAIIWAAEEEIVNGYPGGTFAPNKAISREQIATILYRYAGSPDAEEDLKDYPDADSVSDWAKDAMAWAVENGLINGIKSDNISNLAPQKNATRAQFATIIMRFLELDAE